MTCFLLASNSFATVVSHRMPLVVEAVSRGWRVTVCSPHPSSVAEEDAAKRIAAAGATCSSILLSRSGTAPWTLVAERRELSRVIGKVAPDIAHFVTPKVSVLGISAARSARVPAAVAAISGLGFMYNGVGIIGAMRRSVARVLYRAAIRHGNLGVIFQNTADLEESTRWKLSDNALRVLVRGSGVDLSRFALSPLPSGVPVVVFPGRLLADKGVFEFVRAAYILKERGVSVRMALSGAVDAGNPSSMSESSLAQHISSGAVEHWGYSRDVERVYEQASVVCLPSYREGLSLALAEAAASGRPIVTTDVPGCRDTVEEGTTGLCVPPRDAVALANAIQHLLSDRIRLATMGQAARRFAESHFSVDDVVSAHFALYSTLLSRLS